MKFLALAALAVVYAAECTDDELVDDANCDVTDDAGEVTCTEVVDGDDSACDADDEEEEEEEASSALFAGVASAAVAATMMFWAPC